MDQDYDEQSENNEDPDNYKPSFKKQSKNEQIYGDFDYAYEPQINHDYLSKKMNAYELFKTGAKIETYSSEVEVNLPTSKPKPKKTVIEELEEDDEQPMLGKFNLNSFLNSIAPDGLNQIEQEQNEDSSQILPEGLNSKIITKMQLVKFGEEDTEQEIKNLDELNFDAYMKMNRSSKPKIQPKYKTQEQKDLAREFRDGYGVGFKMLEKMGFKVNKGLGKEQAGIQRPVQAVFKTAFTLKDDTHTKKQKQQSNSEAESEKKQIPIPQKLFQFRSKDAKINNFLLNLKNSYQKLQSQIFNSQSQIQSFKKQQQLNDSIRCQSQNQVNQLSKQIAKLEDIQNNIYNCEMYPHLGMVYKLDLLYVRELFDKLYNCDFEYLYQHSAKEISNLMKVLNNFYLAKTRETLRAYDQSTSLDKKFHKNISRKHKNQQIIDLDNLSNEGVVSIGIEDQQKIEQFLDVILSKCILPKINLIIKQSDSIDKITDIRVVDVLEVAKRYDKKGTTFKQYIRQKIMPLCNKYLANTSLEQLEKGTKKLPHQVIFPWLTVIRPEDLEILQFYRRLSGKLWSIQESSLYNIISPWIKFSSAQQINYLSYFYLAPRLLSQMQKFNINESKTQLLNGFSKYCQLLSFELREEILQNTLLLQVYQTYTKYKSTLEQKQVGKWLARWKKFTNKISPGVFQSYFKEFQIEV